MEKNKWFNHERINENGKVNLICFPHAGGTSAYFAKWSTQFAESINILPVQYPMREKRFNEEMPESIEKLAFNIVKENEDLFKSEYSLFGHCSGSILAYEVSKIAQKLYATNPKYLFVSASVSPSDFEMKKVSKMSKDEFKNYICKSRYADKNLIEDDMVIEYFLPIIRKDFELQEKYNCKEEIPLRCSIIAINGEDDKDIYNEDKINNWIRFTNVEFKSYLFGGDHFYLETNGDEVVKLIEGIILV